MTETRFTFKVLQRRVPFRPRTRYAGYLAFGSGDSAVLVEQDAARRMRAAAAAAYPQETGGLLYGCPMRDDAGGYVVVMGFVQAGPEAGASGGFEIPRPETVRLRDEAARTYPAADEVGWWHSHGEPSLFSSTDLDTQRVFRVGLLVFARGAAWGTAYLGKACLGSPLASGPRLAFTPGAVGDTGAGGSASRAEVQLVSAPVALRQSRLPRLSRLPLLAWLMIAVVILATTIVFVVFLTIREWYDTPRINGVCYSSQPGTYECYTTYFSPASATPEWTVDGRQLGSGSNVTIAGHPHERVLLELVGKGHRQLTHSVVILP